MMEERPIACNLPDAELLLTLQGYRQQGRLFQSEAWIDGDTARLFVRGDKAKLGLFLQAIIEREARCCPFLHISLTERDDGYSVEFSGEGLSASEVSVLVKTIFPASQPDSSAP